MQKTTDCLFIFSPGNESQDNHFDYHLGSAYIISYLKSNGFHARQFIHRIPVSLKNCIKEILGYRPKIAGFTVYDSNFNISVLIAGQIKKASPGTLIVFGGPCPTVHSDFIMDAYTFIDACFIYQSEESFLQFISRLSETNYDYRRTNLAGIPGLSYRLAGKVCKNPENLIFHDYAGTVDYLDKYPSPYISGVIPATEGYNAGVLSARGCNQNCIYCNCAVLSKRRFATHSIERVVGELDLISHHPGGTRVITIQDDAFTLIPQRAAEICKEIIINKIKARFGCITRCDRVDEELLDLMKSAGFVSIAFSLESSNPATLRRIGKVNLPEDRPSHTLEKEIQFIESLSRITSYAKKIGIESIVVSIMTGLPGETIREARRTINVIDRNNNIDRYAHNFLSVYRGTPLFADHKKYGYKISYINNNPVFSRITYPADISGKVSISPKSNLHYLKKSNDKSTLGILSLLSNGDKTGDGFRNIILQSDRVNSRFVKWLRNILTINGTIIQIYSDEKSMTSLSPGNYEMYIKYSSPSLIIRNYCFKETKNGLFLISSQSLLLKTDYEKDDIRICDFKYTISNLDSPKVNFTKTLCREFNNRDSVSAYSFLHRVSRQNNPFSYLTGLKPLPYFTNLCKWTGDLANCVNQCTLFINKESEIRFCWYGGKTGTVGQSYKEIINSFETERKTVMNRRRCSLCRVNKICLKCTAPFPLPESEYCKKRKSGDLTRTAELIISLDQVKQLLM